MGASKSKLKSNNIFIPADGGNQIPGSTHAHGVPAQFREYYEPNMAGNRTNMHYETVTPSPQITFPQQQFGHSGPQATRVYHEPARNSGRPVMRHSPASGTVAMSSTSATVSLSAVTAPTDEDRAGHQIAVVPPMLPQYSRYFLRVDTKVGMATEDIRRGDYGWESSMFGVRTNFICKLSYVIRNAVFYYAVDRETRVEFYVYQPEVRGDIQIRMLHDPNAIIYSGMSIYTMTENIMGVNIIDLTGGEVIRRDNTRTYYDSNLALLVGSFFWGEYIHDFLPVEPVDVLGVRYKQQISYVDPNYETTKFSYA